MPKKQKLSSRPLANLSRRTALGLGITGLLSACAAIPREGEINQYKNPQAVQRQLEAGQALQGPQDGASPLQIIEGFLEAGRGAQEDYKVARLYLTPALAETWRPEEQTLVFDETYGVETLSESSYRLTLPVTRRVDSRGLPQDYLEPDFQELTFSLERVEGQWRISSAPNGTFLTSRRFQDVFSAFTLYFYDPTFSYAVPDVRWFAERSTVATTLVRVLLQGPAGYLQGAVATALPSGASLARNSVPVENGVASVELSGGNDLTQASGLDIERLRTQLTQTLSALPAISSVQLTLNGQPQAQQQLDNYRPASINAGVSSHLVGLESNSLVLWPSLDASTGPQILVEGREQQQLGQVAMNYTRNYFAYTAGESSELWLATSAETWLVHRGQGLLRPSFDHQNWLWLGTREGQVQVLPVTQSQGLLRPVNSWLEGYSLQSLAVSRDGTRALLVTLDESGLRRAWVSAIVRSEDGQPQELLDPLELPATLSPTGAAWLGDREVFVWDQNSGQVQVLGLGGQLTIYDNLPGLIHVTGGHELDRALALTREGGLYIVAGQSWARLESSLSDVNYSG